MLCVAVELQEEEIAWQLFLIFSGVAGRRKVGIISDFFWTASIISDFFWTALQFALVVVELQEEKNAA